MDYLIDFLIDFYGPAPYFIVFFVLLICGLGIPIPEDITLIAAGVICYYGICDVKIMILVCFLGVMVGDSFMFFLGHKFGRRLIQRWPFRLFLNEEKLDEVKKKIKKEGGKMLFAARFMPGVRSSVFFSMGTLHQPYRLLLIYDGIAALLSVPLIVGSVYYFGDYLEVVVGWIKKIEHGILAGIIFVVSYYLIKTLVRKARQTREP